MKNYKKDLKTIETLLNEKYAKSGKRKDYLIRNEMERAEKALKSGQDYELDRAQWGGKWGNFRHVICKNSKGQYQFVSGFNPHKFLD